MALLQPTFVMCYTVMAFRVSNTGNYNFCLSSPAGGNDKHTLLYEDGFDASLPMCHVLTGNDCTRVGRYFSYALSRGKRYFFVIVSQGDEAVDPYSYKITGAGHVIHLSADVGQQSPAFEEMAVNLASMLAIARRKSASQSLGRPASLLSQVRQQVGGHDGPNVHALGAGPLRVAARLVNAAALGGVGPLEPSQSGTSTYGSYLPLKSFLRQAG
jgi:hypothetical protein